MPSYVALIRRIFAHMPLIFVAITLGCQKKVDNADVPMAVSTGGAPAGQAATASSQVDRSRLSAFSVLPEVASDPNNPITASKTELGRMLYFDTRLSKNHDVACVSCHDLAGFGVDGKPVSEGHRKQRGRRNAPTVYNAAGHLAQFWDGRSPGIDHQATQPLLNPIEMATTPERVVMTLQSMPGYVSAFAKAFPGDKHPVTLDNVGRAVGAFERQLRTPGRWDLYLKGDETALSEAERRGLNTFMDTGCTTCHSGPYMGGHLYQKAGLVKPWPNDKDFGRFEVTQLESDRFVFKVPSLRNIARTGPYFHDGSVADLSQAVQMMAEYQLGKTLSPAATADIVAFLGALTGELPQDLIRRPELPAATTRTPAPDPI